jgi:hypothetical protein
LDAKRFVHETRDVAVVRADDTLHDGVHDERLLCLYLER